MRKPLPLFKQVRDLYVNAEALKPAKDGQPLPTGTVLTITVFKAKLDEKGNPLKDDKGRFIKGDLDHINVMKNAGAGEPSMPTTSGTLRGSTRASGGMEAR